MMSRGLDTIDLFAGGGGLSLGFSNAGFHILDAYDNWMPAISFFRRNITDHAIHRCDLSDTEAFINTLQHSPDIIIGGPPCQDFSSAGKRDESLGRADLSVAFATIVGQLKPSYFVMENVDRALKSQTMRQVLEMFRQSGYGLTVKVLDAALCGVPQQRKRLFIIGEFGGQDGFLDASLDAHLAERPMTLRDYFGETLGLEFYYRHPRSYARRGVFSIDEPSPTVRGVNRPLPTGYPGHAGDACPVHAGIRPLTTKERSMIQTFPPHFELIGTKTELEQVIGNAVPVKLAEYVALRLKEHIQRSKVLLTEVPVEIDTRHRPMARSPIGVQSRLV